MTRSWKLSDSIRYERAGSVVLNQVRLGQAPISLRKSRWLHTGGWILLTLAVVAVAAGLWLTWDSRFYVYEAQIVGTRRIAEGDLFDASGLNGLHILWARSSAIESTLLAEFPALESVEVTCGLPADCMISVVERRPQVLWDDQSELWWIDEEGTIFRTEHVGTGAESADAAGGRWVITGPLPRGEDGNLNERVRIALAELWTSGADVPTTFDYEPDRGLSYVDRHGWRVVVGQGSGMAERLHALERLTDHLESHGITPEFIDVRFPGAPYYSPSPD